MCFIYTHGVAMGYGEKSLSGIKKQAFDVKSADLFLVIHIFYFKNRCLGVLFYTHISFQKQTHGSASLLCGFDKKNGIIIKIAGRMFRD